MNSDDAVIGSSTDVVPQRGTIYALYTLSEQMGVSPFHFWSDVPVRSRPAIAFSHGKKLSHGEPTVKYRGVFINDEHPALWSWAAQKWKVKWGEPALLTDMYAPWFEMMLRLKANYFWPASESALLLRVRFGSSTALVDPLTPPVYASMFDVDGMDTYPGFPEQPLPGPNQVLANAMGVVMGTSHHEPMARNKPEWDRGQQGPWDWTNKDFLTEWWTYGAERAKGKETLFTLGMRGDGDMPLTGASNKLVESEWHRRSIHPLYVSPANKAHLRRHHGDPAGHPPRRVRHRRPVVRPPDVVHVQGGSRVLYQRRECLAQSCCLVHSCPIYNSDDCQCQCQC